MKKNSLKNKGFTLIELLVVIAVIGLLSSIVLVSLNSARVKARDARRVADLRQISVALELYYDRYNAYPPYPTTGAAGGAGSDRGDWRNNTGYTASHPLGALKDAGLMAKVPYDPGLNTYVGGGAAGCGAAQFYAYWSNGRQYLLGAVNESQGLSGCSQVGNWAGPTNNVYVYQFYIRN
ncbi:MAG: prepilin-type N-terminal cleavage/methylation domain-containing protein [bacterium]|nr:prepilin-type N-terminal cleavage/methylation domain-containing protein [bacterium]